MIQIKKIVYIALVAFCCCGYELYAQSNVIDEVIWVVGDDAILRSDVENQRLFMLNEGQTLDGDPYCFIPEQLAIQKLYMNQAKIDSVEVSESQVIQEVDRWMNYVTNQIGSKEKVEEYFNKRYSEIRSERVQMVKEQQTVQQMQQAISGDVKLTPADVRHYITQISEDSLPTIPTTVEAQIIMMEPKIPMEETDAIKARLREFTDQINKGEMEFSSLARLYSEDPGSAPRGGELGFTGKASFLPEFANVAFNLNDPNRVSQIVQTEYGFHIIQLIEKRGDRVNCRHILLKPRVSEEELSAATAKMDSLYNDLQEGKFTFDEAAMYVSSDKDTKNNKGIMVNKSMESSNYSTPRFEMHELPQEVGKVIYDMKVGEMSKPFRMMTNNQKEVVAIVKLTNRTEAHKANLSDDFQALKAIVEERKKADVLSEWIKEKQKTTYVRIADGWNTCDFLYPGWVNK